MNEELDIKHPHKINMLMALTGIALSRESDDLAQPMFELIRRFRPESPRVDSFEGWFCLRRGDLVGAMRHLTAAVQALGPEAGASRTLLAMVLCAQGDPSWLTQAQAVIDEGVDPHGAFLMKSMRGDADAQSIEMSSPNIDPPQQGMVDASPLAGQSIPATANTDRRMIFLRG